MGMTINEAIEIGIARKEHYELYGNSQEIAEAVGVLIDTAKKYQKIREIAFPLQFMSTDKLEHEAIMKICEVIEDDSN